MDSRKLLYFSPTFQVQPCSCFTTAVVHTNVWLFDAVVGFLSRFPRELVFILSLHRSLFRGLPVTFRRAVQWVKDAVLPSNQRFSSCARRLFAAAGDYRLGGVEQKHSGVAGGCANASIGLAKQIHCNGMDNQQSVWLACCSVKSKPVGTARWH